MQIVTFENANESSLRLFITQMIQNEYQFEIKTEDAHAIVTFYKGIFQLYTDDGRIHISDSPEVEEKDTLAGAFIETKLKSYRKKGKDMVRVGLSYALYDYLWFKLKLAETKDLTILIYKPGRNGYVSEFGNIEISK